MLPDAKLATAHLALERAYNASRLGSGQATSGTIGKEHEYVQAILARAQEAARSWASWEAINDQLLPSSDAMRAVMWLDLSGLGAIRKALARDAVLGAFGLSDPAKNDRRTLCQLASWLDDDGAGKLSSREWAIEQGYPEFLVDDAASANAERVKRIRSLVVADWTSASPRLEELRTLRSVLRPIRDHLAHALDKGLSEPATVDQIRRFVQLTLELATDAALVWIGSASCAEDYRKFAEKAARNWWSHAFAEPVRLWQLDQVKQKGVGSLP